ncbi:MAG: acyltransferase [Solirubrobacterales bacterium]|nr:acyltransferase [Solirubrobacterales bacterium]
MPASLAARLSAILAGAHSRTFRRLHLTAALVAVGAALAVVLGTGSTSLAQEQTTTAAAAAAPACFGAAARDQLHPCNNSSLRLQVNPTPDDAVVEPNSPCIPVSLKLQPFVCSFGTVKSATVKPTATIALIGDSHAAHWRAALAPVALVRGWAGLSLTRSSCPFSATTPALEEAETTRECVTWNKQVPAWFKRHKEVSVVFTSEHIQARVQARKGTGQFEAKVAGYMKKWKALPDTVKTIVVIKDTPRATGNTGACVSEALKNKKRAGSACAVPYHYAVQKDPAVEAVRRLNSPRYQAVDLTSFFCSSRYCQPVIGGALVYKDPGHITRVYGETLAPYLYRAITALAPFAAPAR